MNTKITSDLNEEIKQEYRDLMTRHAVLKKTWKQFYKEHKADEINSKNIEEQYELRLITSFILMITMQSQLQFHMRNKMKTPETFYEELGVYVRSFDKAFLDGKTQGFTTDITTFNNYYYDVDTVQPVKKNKIGFI